jgi:hypothetical protein
LHKEYQAMARKFTRADILRLAIGLAVTPFVLGFSCPTPPVVTGACCIGGVTCVQNMEQTNCTNAGGVFQGANTTTCANCPAQTATTVLDSQIASVPGGAIPPTATPCAAPTAGFATTFNLVADKAVTVTVTGPTTNSRPQIRVADILGNQVANTGATPTSQANSATFTPLSANLFVLQVNECDGVAPGNVYHVVVTQGP